MSRYIVKSMYLEKSKYLIIWKGGSISPTFPQFKPSKGIEQACLFSDLAKLLGKRTRHACIFDNNFNLFFCTMAIANYKCCRSIYWSEFDEKRTLFTIMEFTLFNFVFSEILALVLNQCVRGNKLTFGSYTMFIGRTLLVLCNGQSR